MTNFCHAILQNSRDEANEEWNMTVRAEYDIYISELLEPVWIINEDTSFSYSFLGENVIQLVLKEKKLRKLNSGFIHPCCC